MTKVLSLILVGFVLLCGLLVAESGLIENWRSTGKSCTLLQQTVTNETGGADNTALPSSPDAQFQPAQASALSADNAPAKTVTLGSIDPNTGFKFQLHLSSKGAAISKATFSEFDNRDHNNPQPLAVISPVTLADDSEILSMANKELVFVEQQLLLRLNELHWQSYELEKGYDGSHTARFEAIIKSSTGNPILKLIKTYSVVPNTYLLDCKLTLENLTVSEQKVRFNLSGPVGICKESITREMRKTVAGFRDLNGQITSERLDVKKLSKAKEAEDRRLVKGGDKFLWAAVVNKYFTAIVVPAPQEGQTHCEWIQDKTGRFYNPDGLSNTGDETIGLDLKTKSIILTPADQPGKEKQFTFQLYIGPKDKSLFDKNELYSKLGFVHTIDFMACCCPARIIRPLAFGILALMKWMYDFIGNYGIVIIILVFLVRLAMHPITKKSQISMQKFTKILSSPEIQEIRKKYAKNQVEMNRQILAFQKERGISPATPIMGMLPMFVQMPVWISLYSAIYTSIELRGAPFLPVWITDLSAPDALVRFATITIPLLGWKLDSLNLLPLLMGVAFFLQQKLMPTQAAASANPQAAQQQKMMMIMMTAFFPLLLYKAPSGLNLYIMSSVFAGVIEQYFIRKHIREKEQAESKGLVAATSKTGAKRKKKKPKPFIKF
ncbi:MAG: YidC/Oxa1 family insertase periplasmic-domain containing protein [Planctomycetota bacterium]|jgi:YidC/Oxa1 family membrane protein insertase